MLFADTGAMGAFFAARGPHGREAAPVRAREKTRPSLGLGENHHRSSLVEASTAKSAWGRRSETHPAEPSEAGQVDGSRQQGEVVRNTESAVQRSGLFEGAHRLEESAGHRTEDERSKGARARWLT